MVNRNGRELPRTREHLRPRRAPVPPPMTDTFTRSNVDREQPPGEQHAPTEPQTQGAPAAKPAPVPPARPLYSMVVASPMRTRSGRVVRPSDRYTNQDTPMQLFVCQLSRYFVVLFQKGGCDSYGNPAQKDKLAQEVVAILLPCWNALRLCTQSLYSTFMYQ